MKITHEYECSICGAKSQVTYELHQSEDPPRPCPPEGWRYVESLMVCLRHQVEADLYLLEPGFGIDQPGRRSLWRPGLRL